MTLSTGETVTIVVIVGLLCYHFVTAKDDPEKTEEIDTNNLNDDYDDMQGKIRQVEEWKTQRVNLIEQGQWEYNPKEFQNKIDVLNQLLKREQETKLYAKIIEARGKGITNWKKETQLEFRQKVGGMKDLLNRYMEAKVAPPPSLPFGSNQNQQDNDMYDNPGPFNTAPETPTTETVLHPQDNRQGVNIEPEFVQPAKPSPPPANPEPIEDAHDNDNALLHERSLNVNRSGGNLPSDRATNEEGNAFNMVTDHPRSNVVTRIELGQDNHRQNTNPPDRVRGLPPIQGASEDPDFMSAEVPAEDNFDPPPAGAEDNNALAPVTHPAVLVSQASRMDVQEPRPTVQRSAGFYDAAGGNQPLDPDDTTVFSRKRSAIGTGGYSKGLEEDLGDEDEDVFNTAPSPVPQRNAASSQPEQKAPEVEEQIHKIPLNVYSPEQWRDYGAGSVGKFVDAVKRLETYASQAKKYTKSQFMVVIKETVVTIETNMNNILRAENVASNDDARKTVNRHTAGIMKRYIKACSKITKQHGTKFYDFKLYRGHKRDADETRAEDAEIAKTTMDVDRESIDLTGGVTSPTEPEAEPQRKKQRSSSSRSSSKKKKKKTRQRKLMLSREQVEYNLRYGISPITEYGTDGMSIIDKTRADRGI